MRTTLSLLLGLSAFIIPRGAFALACDVSQTGAQTSTSPREVIISGFSRSDTCNKALSTLGIRSGESTPRGPGTLCATGKIVRVLGGAPNITFTNGIVRPQRILKNATNYGTSLSMSSNNSTHSVSNSQQISVSGRIRGTSGNYATGFLYECITPTRIGRGTPR